MIVLMYTSYAYIANIEGGDEPEPLSAGRRAPGPRKSRERERLTDATDGVAGNEPQIRRGKICK
jgi:hypothetical protein